MEETVEISADAYMRVALGLLQRGIRYEAKGALLRCALQHNAEWSSRAASFLGQLCYEDGELADAERWSNAAVEYAHPKWSACAEITLGLVHAARGDVKLADSAYACAIHRGHPECVPHAHFNRGALHQQHQQHDLAIDHFQKAMRHTGSPFAAKAANNLGFVLFNYRADAIGAKAAFEFALSSDDPAQANLAFLNLQSMHEVASAEEKACVETIDDEVDVSVASGKLKWRFWFFRRDER